MGTEIVSESGGTAGPVRLKLAVSVGEDAGKTCILDKGTYRVGSAPDCDLVLRDPAVSGTHLLIKVLPASLDVQDNGSTNGSFCNGVRFAQVQVRTGAELKLGRTVLKVLPADAAMPSLPVSNKNYFGGLFGKTVQMREVFAQLERIAETDSDVLIQGETGTGKELCARALHEAGARRGKPFVVVDLRSASREMIESELFGHVRGAFTGAVSERSGAFDQANHGIVLLDGIDELPLELQPVLLRVLEAREIRPVGDSKFRPVDVRVLATGTDDLQERVQQRTFRADLYHRLSALIVRLPPLRERIDDIPYLVNVFLADLKKDPGHLSANTRAHLMSFAWPGNVRELKNTIERVVSLGRLEVAAGPSTQKNVPFKEAKERLVDSFERDYLLDLLKRCENNLSRASREAGIDRVYLRRLLKKHGLLKP